MSWFKARITAAAYDSIQSRFYAAMVGRDVEKAALFTTDPSPEGYDLLFTPRAYAIARSLADELEAQRCELPSEEGLSLMVGDNGAWALVRDGAGLSPTLRDIQDQTDEVLAQHREIAKMLGSFVSGRRDDRAEDMEAVSRALTEYQRATQELYQKLDRLKARR